MSRLQSAAAILDAAEKWKQRCLIDGASLFGTERLWTQANFGELRTYFQEHRDTGTGTFEAKLRIQLEPAPPEARRLWAELTWLYYLIVINVTRITKLDRIRTVWEWSGEALPEDHWALGDVLEGGIVNPGVGYFSHQWREFNFIINLMVDWWVRSARQRETLLGHPWNFAEWLDGLPGGQRRLFRHALLFLLFPDEFEPIMSTPHKRDIVGAFAGQTGRILDVDRLNPVALDKSLLTVVKRLQDERQGEEIHFYKAPLVEIWQGNSSSLTDDSGRSGPDDEAWYQERFGKADIWAIAAGGGARLWPSFLENCHAAIGWDELDDLSEYESRESVIQALTDSGRGRNPSMRALAIWEFVHDVKIGDVFLAKKGRDVLLGWGEVTGEYVHDAERPAYRNLRSVEWHPFPAPIRLNDPITTKTLTRFTPYKEWLRTTFARIDADTQESGVETASAETRPYDIHTALDDLFMEDTQFSRILDSIALRKNLILQGPPGVGKTFIARRIAWCLVGRRDSWPIEMVQFHQSYAYEDFVQGWRPTETGGFTLRDGVFFEFCGRAAKDPETPFVFIIDEINRGNLSRIFGELLMLIEADKRGPQYGIRLTYSPPGEPFNVPENVHLLGLMNTADRSLAIVDYALRRRFAFETLKPAYGSRKFREHLLEADVERAIVDRIDRNMSALNQRICEDKDLGPGFQIGHSYFVPQEEADEQWYLGIIDTQIAPLLQEYWFDRPERVDREIKDLKQ